MTDDTTPPTGGDAPEPEPGSPEWLLAQLSGGRIDSRRERREAEAALEAAGLPIPDVAGEAPATPPALPSETPAPSADERPRARFSWETGTLEAVNRGQETDAEAEVAAHDAEPPAQPTEEAAPTSEPESSPVIPFMWNLAPTNEPDPAVNPRVEIPEPSFNEPDFPFPSAAPLVMPKLIPRSPVEDEPALPVPPTLAVPPAAPEEPVSAAPEDPQAPAAPEEDPVASDGPAPLPPGTTAHEFDPFAQDLFAPVAATTPVPSVDEFTIPDEGSSAPASVPAPEAAEAEEPAAESAQPEQDHVTSDWSDIADMLGAHPETVDTAIVSPMPPVNEILPSFDAVLPRALSQNEARNQAEAQNPAVAQTPPPVRPASAPIEHGRERSPLNRWLLIAAAVLLAILIAVALFTVGRAMAAGRDQAPAAATRTSTPSPTATTPTPTATPTPTDTDAGALAGSGPLAPGQSYQWDKLRGGECIDPFSSPWAQQFAVVDCNAQHAAQLVYTAPFSSDPSAPFPGEQAIASQVGLLCGKPGVVDLTAAAAYSDVQVVAAYPVTAEQWSSGQRNYFCFVTRSSGQQFSSSIAGPGPTQ
ncbi:hypothetical protein [Gryllotalpicola koreensis]|uniref:Septum formation-related domain-containing protein n=1 Tax=Gryllotalpicola koreensis TaxID=993086 RepID=A0ABP7ZPY7_9MICO